VTQNNNCCVGSWCPQQDSGWYNGVGLANWCEEGSKCINERCTAVAPTNKPTPDPTTAEPTTAEPTTANPTTTRPTTSEPTTQNPTTMNPTKRPTEDQSGSGTGWGEPKPTTKAPKPTRGPKPTKAPRTKAPKPVKTPRPTPKPRTPRPTPKPKTPKPVKTRTSRPTNPPRTKAPKPVKTRKPKPTEASNGWGAPNPSKMNEKEDVMAVDMNMDGFGVKETTFSGYSMQTEIAGFISMVFLMSMVAAYSMVCKKAKNEQYVAIQDAKV